MVSQHCRNDHSVTSDTLAYAPASGETRYATQFDHVIFVGKAQHIGELSKKYRNARWWLWLHNYIVDEVPLHWPDLARYPLLVVFVSKTHMQHTIKKIAGRRLNKFLLGWLSKTPVTYIYNPLDDALQPDLTPVQPDKLVFFSSPYKGIDQVLASFEYVHRAMPGLRLHVANPGYTRNFDANKLDRPGVVVLGSLPQKEVLSHVREALCVFYPQSLRPETFGLVYAEANAVGTPVLAHDFGAAREVLCSEDQLVDSHDPSAVVAKLKSWATGGRPVVRGRDDFLLSSVARQWEVLLGAGCARK